MRPAFYVSLNIYFVNRNVSFSRLWLGGRGAEGAGAAEGRRAGGAQRQRGAGGGAPTGGGGPAPSLGAGGPGAAAVRDRGRPPGAAGEGRVRAGTGAPPLARRPPGRAVPRCPDGAAAGAVRGSAPRPEKPRGRHCAPLKAFGCRAGHGNCSGPLRSVPEPLRPARGHGAAFRRRGDGAPVRGGRPCPASPAFVFKSPSAAQPGGSEGVLL